MSLRFARLPLLFLILLVPLVARAALFEQQLQVDDEDDLYTLEQRGDITSDQLETLLELFRDGVDLNGASRDDLYDLPGLTYADCDAIIAYRTARGRIDDPAELVAAGAITAEQLLEVAPFIRIDAARAKLPVSGKVRLVSRYTVGDNVAPPALLSASAKLPWNLSAGLMLATSRRQPATPDYDPVMDTLRSAGFGYRVDVPRFYAQWKSGQRRLVVGTFTIGFAERTTLDTTRRQTPRGIYLTNDFTRPMDLVRTCKLSNPDDILDGGCGADEKNLYITPDFSWREQFRGVAGSVEDVALGTEATLSAYAFLSYQSRRLYQYQLYDRRICDDPADPSPDCKAPPVYLGDTTTRLIYASLPGIFDELAGGGHVTVKPNHRYTLGLTGYGAVPFFGAQPMQLDFQEWSRYPNGGAFGALGVNGQATFGPVNLFIEATRSFDHAVGGNGGGFGVEQRTTFSPRGHELEVSLRYYDADFNNPYARPVSAPDAVDGLRARNELGIRARYSGRFGKDWELKTRHDLWVAPYDTLKEPAGVPNLFSLLRVNFNGWRVFRPAGWVEMRNRNLGSSQHGGCSSEQVILTEGDPYLCSGDVYRIAGRLEFRPLQRLTLATQAWLTWHDDTRYKESFERDLQLWGEVAWQPADWLQLRLRSRYLNQDLADIAHHETNLWTYLDAALLLPARVRLALRYDLVVWLDERSSTIGRLLDDGTREGARVPNPENRLMVDVRTAF